ncbi:MAG TPA: glutathione S-transferase family protein [Gammaproteobacteria bacterium]|jgi:glutathione S-transferase|nr:glutathione S-transferase family protein [Gammaproteobacteria bacterium]
MLTIYGRTNSVNVQKVLWCLDELGVPYERIDAGLAFGKNREPWYLALNPNGRIPLLVDGAFTLWESNTIVRYLASKHGMGTLCPKSPEARALAERWMDWQLSTLVTPVSIVFQALYRMPAADRDAAAIARHTAEANRAMQLLDSHLKAQPYVAGPDFTMGDIPVGAVAYRWLEMDGIERPELAAVGAWRDRLAERPAFRRHVMLPLS